MNITILANKDLASCLALNALLPALQEHRVSVFLSSSVGNPAAASKRPAALRELKFFEQQLFNDILFPALTNTTGELKSFDALGQFTAAPPQVLNRINDSEEFAIYAATKPDLVLSIRYGVILKDAVIALPTQGVLNLHSGHLPGYRGVMATFWALLNGESTLGTTLHYIDDPGIDTGRIVGQTNLAVDSNRSYLWHVLSLYEEGCRLMSDTVQTIAAGHVPGGNPQSPGGQYFTFPEQDDLDRFARLGHSLYSLDEVLDLTRRFLPAP